MAEALLILGASARAAAQSAARAGLQPYCGDLFGDVDLPDLAIRQIADRFPCDLWAIAAAAPPSHWMFTGGLENYPALVGRISRRHKLLGTPADALKRIRDPFHLGAVLAAAGRRFPACRAAPDGLPTAGEWLFKHRRSSGGMKVGLWRGGAPPDDRGWYYQQRIDGTAHGAMFVAAGGRARLLGVARQILNSHADRPFRYAGSIGPIALSPDQQTAVCLLADTLAAEYELHGLFGVDLVLRDEEVWTIEVNPRYTASVEVLERSLGFNAIELHRAACQTSHLPDFAPRSEFVSGKQVVYAERPMQIDAALADLLSRHRGTGPLPLVADIPRPGTIIGAGQPLLTVFAEGDDPAAVQSRLESQAKLIQRLCPP